MKRSKTDAVDAEILAIYCEKMSFEAWNKPADETIELRAFSRRIAALNKLKSQNKNQLQALSSTDETPDLVIQQINEFINVLEKQIEVQRGAALDVINKHVELKESFVLITSIKGIADAPGIQILAELMILPSDMSAKQWIAHAGLDPRIFLISKNLRLNFLQNTDRGYTGK